MDISNNLMDLQYLTNPSLSRIIEKKLNSKKNIEEEMIDPKTLLIYRRKIFLLTKHLLMGNKSKDVNLDFFFLKYCDYCINYFKLEDNINMIQRDHIKSDKNDECVKITQECGIKIKQEYDIKITDKKLFRPKDHKLSNFIIKNRKKHKHIIPQIKKLN